MLKINIEQLEKGPQTYAYDLGLEELDLSDEIFTFEGRVKGEIEFKLIGQDVTADGELVAHAVTPCARCLEPARVEIRVPIHEVWLKRGVDEAGMEEAPGESPPLVEFYEGEEIDLKEPLRELIMAELPRLAYCRADCKGLCPTCGVNLNRETCECPTLLASESEPEWKRKLRGLGHQ